MKITIPHNFTPRYYQLPLLMAMDSGIKRAFCVWHRRAGKDKALWNYLVKEAVEIVGTYYYFFPTYAQAKKVIWDGIDNDGFSFLDHIPKEIIEQKNGQEMKIKLKNGSIIQLVGTDKYDAVRGTNPRGCVFSEFAFHNPMAWEVVRPILAVNGGWAIFNTTPNGKNHAYKLFNFAKENPKWFSEILSVEMTNAVPDDVLEEERLGMSREMFLQEYFCSFEIGAVGSVFGEEMERAADRITQLPFYPEKGIYISTDLGVSDSTALWFFQVDGEFVNCIHYYENNRKQIDHYFKYIDDFLEKKGTQLNKIVLPHDSTNSNLVSNESVFSLSEKHFGGQKVQYHQRGSIQARIDKTRAMFPRFRFDKDACHNGIDCLENYKYRYDEIKKVFSKEPDHNWASHGSDAFGYGAEFLSALSTKKDVKIDKNERLPNNYDRFSVYG